MYSYACNTCGHSFDVRQSFSDDALTDCPQCPGPLRKVYGTVGVVFKGSGFYRNDSRSAPGSGKPTADSTAGGSSSPGSDTAASSTSDGKAGSGGSAANASTASGSGSSDKKSSTAARKPAATAAAS